MAGAVRPSCYIRARPWPTSPESERRSSAPHPRPDDPSRNRRLLMYGGVALIALAAVAAAVFLAGFGGNDVERGEGSRRARGRGVHAAGGEGAARPALARAGRDGRLEHRSAHERPALRLRRRREPRHRDLGRVRGAAAVGSRGAQPRARRHLHLLRRRGPGRGGSRASGVLRLSRARNAARSVPESRRRDRARSLGLGRRRRDGLPGEVHGVQRGGVLRVLQRVPVPEARSGSRRARCSRATTSPASREARAPPQEERAPTR